MGKRLTALPAGVPEYARLLRAERRGRGLSQAQVGELVGVYSSVISSWERGRRDITLSSLVAWAAALGFEIFLLPIEVDE